MLKDAFIILLCIAIVPFGASALLVGFVFEPDSFLAPFMMLGLTLAFFGGHVLELLEF